MEALRYLPYLKKEGWLVTNSEPFINIPNYPEVEKVNEIMGVDTMRAALQVRKAAKLIAESAVAVAPKTEE